MKMGYSLLHSHRSSVYQVEAVMHKGLAMLEAEIALSHAGSHGRVTTTESDLPDQGGPRHYATEHHGHSGLTA